MSGASVNCPVRKCRTGYYQGEVCGLRREDREEREGVRGERQGRRRGREGERMNKERDGMKRDMLTWIQIETKTKRERGNVERGGKKSG